MKITCLNYFINIYTDLPAIFMFSKKRLKNADLH